MAEATEHNDGRHLVATLGTGVVAAALDEALNTVSNWRARGVPRAKRPAVAEVARQHGVDVPAGFLAGRRSGGA